MKDKKHIQSFNEHQENLNISDVSESKHQTPKIGTKVKLTKSIGREYVHPNDAIFIGSVGTIIDIDREEISKVVKSKKHIHIFKDFLNENLNNDLIKDIEESIDEKMDELIGRGDYNVGYSEDQDRFIISFREGDIQESCDMADEVVDFVNIERNILRVGNCGKSMFWLTWFNK